MEINRVYCADVNSFLENLSSGSVDLVYLDPPFNTNTVRSNGENSFVDRFDSHDNYLDFISGVLKNVRMVMKPNASLLFHIDYRESHYCKILLDNIFGIENYINEIIWAYDYGARSKVRYSPKHDTIFWYSMDRKNYKFNFDDLERIPYMAPGLAGLGKALKGKTITDVIWNTIVPTRSKERVGYPTQKPLALLEKFVRVHSEKGDLLVDPMCGSGSFGEAAKNLGRNFILNDEKAEAVRISRKRLGINFTDDLFSSK